MNNEEKILAMLEKHDAMFEKQAALLEKLTNDMTDVKAAQTEQGKQLAEQGKQLAEQGKQLAELANRVDSIDTWLGKVEDMQEELRSSVNTLAKKIDHDVIPYVKLLDEDYRQAREQPVLVRRVDSLEEDVHLLKNTVKKHVQQLSMLEKAN